MRRAAEQGFTLLEMLVALAVFSLAALALVNLAGENVRTAGLVEARTLAGIVAENRAVEASVSPVVVLGERSGEETQGARTWTWTQTIAETEDPAILRVDIAVRESGQTQVLAALSVLRGRR